MKYECVIYIEGEIEAIIESNTLKTTRKAYKSVCEDNKNKMVWLEIRNNKRGTIRMWMSK